MEAKIKMSFHYMQEEKIWLENREIERVKSHPDHIKENIHSLDYSTPVLAGLYFINEKGQEILSEIHQVFIHLEYDIHYLHIQIYHLLNIIGFDVTKDLFLRM